MATTNTYSKVGDFVSGNYKERVTDITLGTTYTASGYTLAAADYQALAAQPGTRTTTQSLSNMISFDSETNLSGQKVSLDRTNSKLLVWEAGAQATTTSSSGAVVRVRVRHGAVNFQVTP